MAATDLEHISLDEILDPATRKRWIEENHMTVLSFASAMMPATEVDLFAAEPFPFEAAYERAVHAQLQGISVTVASLQDLIALKRSAGRPQDLEDVQILEAIENELGRRE